MQAIYEIVKQLPKIMRFSGFNLDFPPKTNGFFSFGQHAQRDFLFADNNHTAVSDFR